MLLHAVTDALLGAAALGDIGQLYPDTDPAQRNRDSAQILAEVVDQVQQGGYRVVNADCIVFAERPKLAAYKQAIQGRLAELLQVSPSAVGVKAKTGEGLGKIGRQQAIAAQCVALMGHDG